MAMKILEKYSLKMRIKCKKSNRFLCEVNIEQYLANLEELGISQQIPLEITIPCRACREIETYEIYSTRYAFKNKEKSKK